jgi:methionine-S-sulfoxide reductase
MIRRLGIVVLCTLGLVASASAVAAKTTPVEAANTATALFAGGCFWCIEADFEKLPGVIGAESGYTAGTKSNPTYEQVSAGGTGHTEAVRVTYEPGKVSYAQLVEFFWRHIDPTVKDKQFCDSGNQYRSGIYWQNADRARDCGKQPRCLAFQRKIQGNPYRDRRRHDLLSGRGIPSGLLQEESDPLRLLPQRLRQGCTCAATLGEQVAQHASGRGRSPGFDKG